MRFFLAPASLIVQHWTMLRQTVWTDLRARYAGSILGLLWMIVYPLLFLGVYAGVCVYVFRVRVVGFGPAEYVALVFCGLIPFLGFAEALGQGVASVTSNANLIKNTLYPIELIPVKAVLMSQSTQVVGSVLLLVMLGVMGKLTWWALMFPVIWLAQVAFTFGLIWILASMNVYLRDLQNVVSVLVLMLMLGSPIAYTADMVPDSLQLLLWLNPLAYVIVSFQDCLMLGQFPRGNVFWILLGMSAASLWLGYWFFSRLKRVFADNV